MGIGGFTDGAADSKGPDPVFGNIDVTNVGVIVGDNGAGVVVILDPIDGTADPSGG